MHTQPTINVNAPAARVRHRALPPTQARNNNQTPHTRRVFALTFWAAISIFIGLIPAGRLVVGVAFHSFIFPWYPWSTASIGILGLILIASAYASIHRARLPWYLMTIATSLLAVNVAMVYLVSFQDG